MSGCSSCQDCPNCGGKNTLNTNSDWKPHETCSGECLSCGYFYNTTSGVMTKEELKNMRDDLKERGEELPKLYRGINKIKRW